MPISPAAAPTPTPPPPPPPPPPPEHSPGHAHLYVTSKTCVVRTCVRVYVCISTLSAGIYTTYKTLIIVVISHRTAVCQMNLPVQSHEVFPLSCRKSDSLELPYYTRIFHSKNADSLTVAFQYLSSSPPLYCK